MTTNTFTASNETAIQEQIAKKLAEAKPAAPQAEKPATKKVTRQAAPQAKPETKPAATAQKQAKPQAEKKAAPKSGGKTVRKPQAAKSTSYADIHFLPSGSMRPGSGNALASFTVAWMTVSGMSAGNAIPRYVITDVAGATMLSHHLNKGTLIATSEGIKLTDDGMRHFGFAPASEGMAKNRNIKAQPDLVAAYVALMLDGKLDPNIGIKQENQKRAVSF